MEKLLLLLGDMAESDSATTTHVTVYMYVVCHTRAPC